jgi:Mg2+ and Co2+ transporter CorA
MEAAMDVLEGLKNDLGEMTKELSNIAEMLKSKKLSDDDYMVIRNQLTEKTALIQSLQREATFRLQDDIAELLDPVEKKLQEVLEIARTRQTLTSLNIVTH